MWSKNKSKLPKTKANPPMPTCQSAKAAEIIPIEKIQVINLHPEDKLIIKINTMLREQKEIDGIEKQWSEKFGCKVILMDLETEIAGIFHGEKQ